MPYGEPPQGNPYYYSGPPVGEPAYGPPPGLFNQDSFPVQPGGFLHQGDYGRPPQGQFLLQQGVPGRLEPAQFLPHHQASFGGLQGQLHPPQAGFSGPPPPFQGFGAPPMGLPSPGYDPHATAQGDASQDADALRAAMKGFVTNATVLIKILSKPDALQIALLRNTYSTRLQRNLEQDISSKTSGHFGQGLVALVRGPLMQDVY